MRTKSIEYYIVDSELRSLFNGFVEEHDWTGGQKPDDFRVYFDNNEDTGVIEFLLDSEWVEELGIEQDFNAYIQQETNHTSVFDLTTNQFDVSVEFPNDVCFAFNYNSIKISRPQEHTDAEKIIIVVSDAQDDSIQRTIEPALYGMETEIPISNLLKQFVSIPNKTSSIVNVSIYSVSTCKFHLSFQTCVIFGALNIGQRFANIGKYDNASHAFVRNITWFKNFPSRYSFFARNGQTQKVFINQASEVEDETVIDSTGIKVLEASAFDENGYFKDVNDYLAVLLLGSYNRVWQDEFDYTYGDNLSSNPDNTMLVFNMCCRKDGVFLRWIDNRGLWFSYLFDKKEEVTDVDTSEYSIENHIVAAGMQFGGNTSIDKTETKKIVCNAQQLTKEAFDDICTIGTALYVEMYICGEFYRVNINPKSIVKTHKKELNEIEIEVVLNKTKYMI